jgi:hypothetical protein
LIYSVDKIFPLNEKGTIQSLKIIMTFSFSIKHLISIFCVSSLSSGDHTTVDLFLTVLPPKSEAVIFSIDGSFTSSFSVSHHDPKVRPGAVDVVR